MDEASRKGTSVLVASTDAEQLAQICHRSLVFSKGQLVSELTGAAITKDNISQETLRAHGDAGETVTTTPVTTRTQEGA